MCGTQNDILPVQFMIRALKSPLINMSKKRVAVIGAGCSGLTAIKCCLDEGLEPVCFERTSYIGGLWHYTDNVEEGQACVMKSTVINTSKEMMCYSDYPIPAEFPMYMHNTCVDKYFNMYADNFGLKQYIQYNTEVLSVKPLVTHSNGQWEITTKHNDMKTVTQAFDAVLVCTGHHAEKKMPNFPGLDKFSGKVIHTHDYKDFRGYEDKRVMVVGIGNSGVDVAIELSRISKQVYLSTRSGSWIFDRVGENGEPLDAAFNTRFNFKKAAMFPNQFIKDYERRLNKKFNHATFCLQPEYHPFSAHPTVSDELPNRLVSGGIIVKGNVREFTDTGVIFEDGSKVDQMDAVVLATGYIFGFPFMDKSVTEVKENEVNLYKYTFPPDLKKPTLAIIGCFQPLGAIMPICEMQCRLATRVFQDKITLPSREDMWCDIRTKHDAMAQQYNKSTRHTIQVNYLPFMDELAELVGCKPNLGKLLLTDPKLAIKCYFGPGTPYQFRLMGPGTWKGAREAIFTQWDRLYASLQTRPCKAVKDTSGFGKLYMSIIIAVAIVAISLFK